MTNYREILRLSSLGLNKAQIAGACGCSRTTVIKVLSIAAAQGLSYPLPDGMSDKQLADTIVPANAAKPEYKKPALLILDEWLLYQLKESEARDLLEIAEARYKKGSMIFCSQFYVPVWRDKIGSPIIADAICDRIVHDSYRIVIECEESMRKRKGVNEEKK